MNISAKSLDGVIDALAEQGWCVVPDFLPPDTVAALRTACLARHRSGAFHRAGVGSGNAQLATELRGDAILWLEPEDTDTDVSAYMRATEALRQAANRELFLGLAQLEAHFAVYPEGAYYKKHLDRFRDDDRRTLTAIVYLNADWSAEDGGLLRFWPDPTGAGEALEIVPTGGTLVTFLSDRFWHEVTPARRERLAITGWFKRR